MIKLLDWDTQFFNLKVGQTTVVDTLNHTLYKNFDLLYVFQDKELPLAVLEGFKASLKMPYVEYEKTLDKSILNSSTGVVSFNREIHSSSQLYKLAELSGRFSRFKLDPNIDGTTVRRFYEVWIKNSITTDLADDILIYIEGGSIVGFVSYKIYGDIAKIGLIAVNPMCQGKGIGGLLLQELEYRLLRKKIFKLKVVTQETNIQASMFYAKQAFHKLKVYYITHFWKI